MSETKENCRKIAEWLGWQEQTFLTIVGSKWHSPKCTFDGTRHSCDSFLGECGAALPDFYTDEAANALVLEKFPSPCLCLETLHSPVWACWPESFRLNPDLHGKHADRKTAIVEAALKFIEVKRDRE